MMSNGYRGKTVVIERIRGRLAPSPTGAQHIGNARTYLIAWLWTRSRNGELVLRIEDIDSPRIKEGAAQQSLDDLRWLGLDWDGEPVVQTSRMPLYRAVLDDLKARELVYPCSCSRSDILNAASAPHAEHEGPSYPGTCASRNVRDADRLGSPYSWRFRVRESPMFRDEFVGPTHINLFQLGGDFVIWKNTDTPAYQLAVVADDSEMQITEVLRGDDLIPSTPRQILLYQALQKIPPMFAHVPLVTGEDGRRLAKRHGDTRISSLRELGIHPERIVGWLAWSCGWIDKIEPMTPTKLLALFSLKTIPRMPIVFSESSLNQLF
jgi:glutamyl-tRNA synthetase